MGKIHILIMWLGYEDFNIIGVYKTKKRAREVYKDLMKNMGYKQWNPKKPLIGSNIQTFAING